MKRIQFPGPEPPAPAPDRRRRRWRRLARLERTWPVRRLAAVSALVVAALAIGITVGRLSGKQSGLRIDTAAAGVAGISIGRDGQILVRPLPEADPELLLGSFLDLAFGVQAARAAREVSFEPQRTGYCPGTYHAALVETDDSGWLLRLDPPADCSVSQALSALLLQAWGIGVPVGEQAAVALESVRLAGRDGLILVTMNRRSGSQGAIVRGELINAEGRLPLWEWDPARHCPYDLKRSGMAIFSGVFEAIDLDGDGVREIVATANHSPLYPGVLAVLEAATGRELAAFWNCGHLRLDAILRDPDDPAGDLMLVSGFANCAVLGTHHFPYAFAAGIGVADFLRSGGGEGPLFGRDPAAAQQLDAACDALVPLLHTASGALDSSLTAADRQAAAAQYATETASASPHELLARRLPVRTGGGYRWYAVFPPLEPAICRGLNAGCCRLSPDRLELCLESGQRYCLTPAGEFCGPLSSSRLAAALHPIADRVIEDFAPVIYRPE